MSPTIEIPNFIIDRRIQDYIISDYPSISIDNEFIPVHSLNNGTLLRRGESDRLLVYSLDVQIRNIYIEQRFSTFSESIATNNTTWMKLGHPTINRTYIGIYGLVVYFEENEIKPEPMVALCVRRKKLFSISKESPDPKHFCLVINRKLYKDEEHNKLYRNLNRFYVEPMSEIVDVYHTDKILELCYNSNGFSLPKFKTIQENIECMNMANQLIINSYK